MSGTHRDFLFQTKSRCFASKNNTWGLWPIETSNSDANHTVLPAQNDRRGLGPIEIRYSGTKLAVLRAKTTDEGWNPYSLFILALSPLLCVLKTTVQVWDPYRLVGLVLKSLFCTLKTHRWGLEPIKTCHSGANHAVLQAKTTDEGWVQQTCNFGPQVAVLKAQNHRWRLDP